MMGITMATIIAMEPSEPRFRNSLWKRSRVCDHDQTTRFDHTVMCDPHCRLISRDKANLDHCRRGRHRGDNIIPLSREKNTIVVE